MLRRLNIQILKNPEKIWPFSASILLHAVFLALLTVPRAPKVPEFLVVEMSSIPLPQFSAPAKASAQKAAAAQAVAVVQPKTAQPQPVEKRPEMAEPLKHVSAPAAVVQKAAPVQSSASGPVSAASTAKASNTTAKTGPAAPSGPVEGRFGASDGPAFIHSIQPTYPHIARKLGKEGTVLLRITLDEKGGLVSVTVVEKAGHGFDEAAVNAVKASRFRTARQRGVPVACRALLPIRFKLED